VLKRFPGLIHIVVIHILHFQFKKWLVQRQWQKVKQTVRLVNAWIGDDERLGSEGLNAFMNEMIGPAINEMIGPVIVFYHDNTKFYQWEKYRPVGYTLCNVNSNCIFICMVLKTDHCQFSFNLPMIFRTPPFPRPSHMPLVMSTPPEVARHATGIRSLLPTRLTGEAYRALLIKMFSFI
jgi:hypothetical protein